MAAIEWTIKEGDPIAGGTIYHLADKMDAGAIAAQDWVFVKKGETARELWERALAPLGLRLLAEVIDSAKAKGTLPAKPQDEQFATQAPALDPARH
jgi:methionyl-tRNA formyltransferase